MYPVILSHVLRIGNSKTKYHRIIFLAPGPGRFFGHGNAAGKPICFTTAKTVSARRRLALSLLFFQLMFLIFISCG